MWINTLLLEFGVTRRYLLILYYQTNRIHFLIMHNDLSTSETWYALTLINNLLIWYRPLSLFCFLHNFLHIAPHNKIWEWLISWSFDWPSYYYVAKRPNLFLQHNHGHIIKYNGHMNVLCRAINLERCTCYFPKDSNELIILYVITKNAYHSLVSTIFRRSFTLLNNRI